MYTCRYNIHLHMYIYICFVCILLHIHIFIEREKSAACARYNVLGIRCEIQGTKCIRLYIHTVHTAHSVRTVHIAHTVRTVRKNEQDGTGNGEAMIRVGAPLVSLLRQDRRANGSRASMKTPWHQP